MLKTDILCSGSGDEIPNDAERGQAEASDEVAADVRHDVMTAAISLVMELVLRVRTRLMMKVLQMSTEQNTPTSHKNAEHLNPCPFLLCLCLSFTHTPI